MKIRKKRRSGSGIAQEPSTRDVVCWSAAILLPAAIYFSAAADLPHVLVITCLLLLFSSSLMMISLGIIGYYIARIYDEIKGRPRYIVSKTCGEREEKA